MALFNVNTETKEKETYTHKVQIPQYEMKGKCPNICELTNNWEKYNKLVSNIDLMLSKNSITQEQADFLYMAATRHIAFNYSNIAEYYAHASKEMQELMEESALVIIDFDDALANGYVKLSEDIKKIMMESGKPVAKDIK